MLVLSVISLKSIRQLAIYHSSGPWQSALKSFRQDSRGHKPEKEKPTTPGIGLQHQIYPFTQLTTPPLRRQSKQVTILKLQRPRCHLTNFTATHALPSLSCTLACWSRSRYLSLHNACSPPLRSWQAKSSASFGTNSHWLHLPGILSSFTTSYGSFFLLPPPNRTVSRTPIFKLASGLLSAAPVFLGSHWIHFCVDLGQLPTLLLRIFKSTSSSKSKAKYWYPWNCYQVLCFQTKLS